MKPYGCHNRPPIVTFGAKTCQYTLTEIGKKDPRCVGFRERKE